MKRKKFNHIPKKYSKPGRKGVYDSSVPDRAYRLCLLGCRNEDLASAFGVNVTTIEYWLRNRPEFEQAIQQGKKDADTQVALSLYQKATGYKHKDTYITQYKGQIITREITKHYPPDTTAAIFWLKNRHPELWADVQQHKHTGNIQHDHLYEIDLSDLTEKELQALETLGLKDFEYSDN